MESLIMIALCGWNVLAVGGLAAWAAWPRTESGEMKLLWQIGKPDKDDAEFALAPDGWRRFAGEFATDPVFVVGRSEPKKDWPYAQPGPVDVWAGSRAHTFTIFFGLKEAPRTGECRLVCDLVDTHNRVPPKLRIEVNGQPFENQMPVGATDDSLYGKPAAGRPHQFDVKIPAAALKAGNNALTITSLSGSWIIYDAVTFEAPEGTAGAPVQPLTTVLTGQSPPVLLKQDDGSLAQQVQLSIQHTGDPVEAEVAAGGGKPVPVSLKLGNQQVTLAVPAVEKPTAVAVTVTIGGQTAAQRQVEVKPVRKWVVYLLPHSHNDIGYTHVQTEVEKRQWGFLETVIEAARKTADYPEGARFKWNVEVMWAVDGYLRQATPEKQQAFIAAVKAGWVELDALYGNELTGLCRPEELIRLVECAGRVARRCGVPLETAMISDVPGYTWGLVPVLADAGVKYFSVGPNGGDRIGGTLAAWGDKPFYWISPSGQQKVLCWLAGTGYGFFHGANLAQAGERPVLNYLQQLTDSGYPYDLVQVRYSTGGDNGPPDPTMSDFVKQWNSRYAYPKLMIATVSELFRDFERRYGEVIPKVAGDFTPYWEDGAASSARETGINRASAERLVQAEALFALLNPAKYPVDEFYTAWRNVILYDEHTWGAWNSISEPDAPFVKQQWQIKQAFALDGEKQSRKLLAEALAVRGAAADQKAAAIDVFNTSSWTRTDLVTMPKEWATVGDVVKGPDGAAAPSQRLSTGELIFLAKDMPPLAARRYALQPGKASAGGKAKAAGAALSTPTLSVKIDEQSGAIASLQSAPLKTELVSGKAAVALNDYRYMLGSDAAGAKTNGPVRIIVKEAGPLVAALLIVSDAPGCNKLTREVRVIDGLDRVDIINVVAKQPIREKEGVHFGFAFNVPDGVVRTDMPWAVVRPEADQIPGACKNWLAVQRWVDISNAGFGVTWATIDAPLVEIGAMTADKIGSQSDPKAWIDHLKESQTLYSWAMNNHWHTNYKADQEGPTLFRYSLQPHAGFDTAVAERFGTERSQPLIVVPAPATDAAAGNSRQSFLQVEPASVLVSALKPAQGGTAILVRLFNASERPAKAALTWREPAPKAIWLSNLSEEQGGKVSGAIELPAWGLVTLRCEWP